MKVNIFLCCVFFLSFACSAVDKNQFDDLLLESTIAIVAKDYDKANQIVAKLLNDYQELTFGQKVEVLNTSLELSFINKNYKKSSYYGHKLFDLLGENDKYSKLRVKLKIRLCDSDDWSPARTYFDDICKNIK